MTNINDTSPMVKRLYTSFLSVWREIGILMLTASLLFLPWFRDPSPPEGRPPLVAGMEFISHGTWYVILAFATACLSYVVSRFSNRKWAGMIILVITWLLYFYIHLVYGVIGIRHAPDSTTLGRGHVEAEVVLPAVIGMWVNWLGLIFLTAGVYLAERGQGRTAVVYAALGGFSGLALLVGSVYTGFVIPEILLDLKLLPRSETTYMILTWLQILGLPVGGAIWGARAALKKSLPATV